MHAYSAHINKLNAYVDCDAYTNIHRAYIIRARVRAHILFYRPKYLYMYYKYSLYI